MPIRGNPRGHTQEMTLQGVQHLGENASVVWGNRSGGLFSPGTSWTLFAAAPGGFQLGDEIALRTSTDHVAPTHSLDKEPVTTETR
jgi:hypothetical protein